ncbi:hypothetical protein ACPXB5_11405 [Micromonospora arida]|uniref:hypothetical protein n=1 Tax=Micromonospora arida TaxID=2203715 RepID=UPI003CECE452
MTAAKRKGTAFETLLVRALTAFGIKAYRPAQAGRTDVGDLHGLSPFIGQCKAYKSWEEAIRLGLDGAEKQRVHAGEAYGVAFVKRVRRSVGEAYAVTTVATFARLLIRLRRAEEALAAVAPDTAKALALWAADELAQEFPRGTEGKDTE